MIPRSLAIHWVIVALASGALAGCGGGGGGGNDIEPPPPPVPATLNIAVTTLSQGVLGVPYNQTIRVTGGTGARTFETSEGALPDGLTLDGSTGVISGIPAGPSGATDFIVIVADSGSPQQTDSQEFTITINLTSIGRNDTIATATPIGNGTIQASISPSGDPGTMLDPDEDYYEITLTATSTVSVDIDAQGAGSPIDTVIEIVDASGNRLNTCGAPAFTSECVNDDSDTSSATLDSFLEVRVQGATKFYIHVVDWGGNARPDFLYDLTIGGVN